MEAGIKGTQSRFTNDVTVSIDKNGVPISDPSLTANYKLKEYIGAAYTAFDLKLDAKTDIKIGLRYEYTNSNLGTEQQSNIVDRQYGNFFPSFLCPGILPATSLPIFPTAGASPGPPSTTWRLCDLCDPYTFFG